MKLRVAIADDHAVLRGGLRALLESEPDLTVVAEAGSGFETMKLVREEPVDVLILDLSMPGGISATQIVAEARTRRRWMGIVVLTMHEDESYVREMLRAGVQAYVLKKSAPSCLTAAVRAAHRRQRYVDPALSGLLVATMLGEPVGAQGLRAGVLSAREQEVCALLAKGHTNGEVGRKLKISERTVESHRAKLMSKLGLRSRAELVRYALEQGLLEQE